MKLLALTLAAAALAGSANAAMLTFDSLSSPVDVNTPTYSEGGFDFTSSSTSGFGSWGTTSLNFAGSTGMFNDSLTGSTTTMVQDSGLAFSVYGLNLSELFFFSPTSDVTFTGTTSTGGTVSQTFTLDGSFGYEVFNFSSVFTDLVALSWDQTSGFHQFDNIRVAVDPVPLPAGGALLLTALGAGFALRRRKKST